MPSTGDTIYLSLYSNAICPLLETRPLRPTNDYVGANIRSRLAGVRVPVGFLRPYATRSVLSARRW